MWNEGAILDEADDKHKRVLVLTRENVLAWKIATARYGSEGEEPRNLQDCPAFRETGNELSCISGSGGSVCAGFQGRHAGYVYCSWGNLATHGAGAG